MDKKCINLCVLCQFIYHDDDDILACGFMFNIEVNNFIWRPT